MLLLNELKCFMLVVTDNCDGVWDCSDGDVGLDVGKMGEPEVSIAGLVTVLMYFLVSEGWLNRRCGFRERQWLMISLQYTVVLEDVFVFMSTRCVCVYASCKNNPSKYIVNCVA